MHMLNMMTICARKSCETKEQSTQVKKRVVKFKWEERVP